MEDEGSNSTIPAIQMEPDNASSSESNTFMDLSVLDSPNSIPSPARSETDSVNQALGPTFLTMGYDPQIWADALARPPKSPSQSSQME